MSITEEKRQLGFFAGFPTELRHHIFEKVEPEDLLPLSLTCSEFNELIKDNRALCRAIYLAFLDEPPTKPNSAEYDWVGELHKSVKTRKILQSSMDVDEKTQYLPFVTDVVTRWMQTASTPQKEFSYNIGLLTYLFENPANQEAFFCNSTIFARARRGLKNAVPSPGRSYEERQLSAKLHTIYGVPIVLPKRTRFVSPYPYACSVVYDLRNYNTDNMWGPYRDDSLATVDWERLEAVMIVLGHNLRMFTENTHGVFKPLWSVPWQGATPDTFLPMSLDRLRKQPLPPANALDPYNVSGTYMRVVCFLDFSELFAYNFNTPRPADGEPRAPIDTTEAIRLIIMEITVDNITDPGPDDGQDLPVVHFKGTSRSMHTTYDPNANSNITGTVRLTKEGEVRWRSLSSYQGEERWKSEGIQIGGPKSSRGVLGHWFDKDYDHHGPAGPTAFWKISNEIDQNPSGGDDLDGPGDEDEDEEDEDESSDEDGIIGFNAQVDLEIAEAAAAAEGGTNNVTVTIMDLNDPSAHAALAEEGPVHMEGN